MKRVSRRSFIATSVPTVIAASLPIGFGFLPKFALAGIEDLKALAVEAAKLKDIVWYESSTDEQTKKAVDAFVKAYPQLRVRHVRIDASSISARVMLETQAGAPTADIGITTGDQVFTLSKHKMLVDSNWGSLGVNPELIAHRDFLASATGIYTLLWNKNNVPIDQVPNSWEDLLNPRWKNRIGTWVRPAAFVALAQVWGKDKTTQYVEKFARQNPVLSPLTSPLAQQVGAGELDVGIGVWNTAQAAIDAGAPIGRKLLEPVPVNTLYAFVPKNGKNTAGGRLFAAWLTTAEGARAYESGTGRGNRLVAGTPTAELLAGRQVAEFPPEKSALVNSLTAEFTDIINGAAR